LTVSSLEDKIVQRPRGEAVMTRKRELVDKIALESACPKVTVSRVVNLLLSEITEALCKEGRLELRGFGEKEV
jgi:nucleoid DNA-binding protein